MMKLKVHIVSINIFHKDAIGNFCHDLKNVYQSAGLEVTLYAMGSDIGAGVQPYENLFAAVKSNDIIFYHHSIYDPYLATVKNLERKKIVYFHGITPPSLLAPYAPQTAEDCEKGLAQISLLENFDLYVANSQASVDQFRQHANYLLNDMLVLPPVLASRMQYAELQSKQARIAVNEKTVLCVGRIAPNKKIEDVIHVITAYRKQYPNHPIKLQVVGSVFSSEYEGQIRTLVTMYGCDDMVTFLGLVTDNELKMAYQQADCYMLMSEHEGFGVPLFEALLANVPILAYRQNGVVSVLHDAGCQVTQKNYDEIAKRLHEILHDEEGRNVILAAQQMRAKVLLTEAADARYLSLIDTVTELAS